MLIVGTGRGGSHVADLLARAGRRSFVLVDPDILEAENVANHLLGPEWVGRPKAEGVANHLWTEYGADVNFFVGPFGFDLLDQGHPVAPLIYGQELILAHTDDPAMQRAIAVVAAHLEIPCIATGVYLEGGGEVFAQLDIERDPCYGCFTHPRHAAQRGPRLRGRDLDLNAGDAVDLWTHEVALAVLEPRSRRARRVFQPNARTGLRVAWDIPAGGGAPQPLNVERRVACPVCGDASVGGPSPDPSSNRDLAGPGRTLESVVVPVLIAGAVMLVAAAFGWFLADPHTGSWIFFHRAVAWGLSTSRSYALPVGVCGAALLAVDGLIIGRYLDGTAATAISCVGVAVAIVAVGPLMLVCLLAALTITTYIVIAVVILWLIVVMLGG